MFDRNKYREDRIKHAQQLYNNKKITKRNFQSLVKQLNKYDYKPDKIFCDIFELFMFYPEEDYIPDLASYISASKWTTKEEIFLQIFIEAKSYYIDVEYIIQIIDKLQKRYPSLF